MISPLHCPLLPTLSHQGRNQGPELGHILSWEVPNWWPQLLLPPPHAHRQAYCSVVHLSPLYYSSPRVLAGPQQGPHCFPASPYAPMAIRDLCSKQILSLCCNALPVTLTEFRASCMLGEHSATESYPKPHFNGFVSMQCKVHLYMFVYIIYVFMIYDTHTHTHIHETPGGPESRGLEGHIGRGRCFLSLPPGRTIRARRRA